MTSSKPTTRYQDIRHNVAKIKDYLARGGGLDNVLSEQSMAYDAIRMCFLEISEAAVKLGALAELHEPEIPCTQLLDEADRLSPDSEPRVRALLTLQTQGFDQALNLLETATTSDGALLRTGLRMEADRHAEARVLLGQWDSLDGKDAEWHRLKAFLACIDRDAGSALEQIGRAELLAPDWVSVIETGAIVRYATALSPVVPFRTGSLPEPVAAECARQDDASRQRLLEASERFDRLAKTESRSRWQQRLRLWHFACLALLPERAAESQAACLSLINDESMPAAAVFWALARQYPIPLKPVIQRLEAQLRSPTPSIDDVQATIACALAVQDIKKAAAILRRESGRFTDSRAQSVLRSWEGRIAIDRNKLPPPETIADPLDRAQTLITVAAKSGEWGSVEGLLRSIPDRPDTQFIACNLLASHQQWQVVSTHVDRLVEVVRTADAVKLAAYTWYHTRQFDRAIDILDRHTRLSHLYPSL